MTGHRYMTDPLAMELVLGVLVLDPGPLGARGVVSKDIYERALSELHRPRPYHGRAMTPVGSLSRWNSHRPRNTALARASVCCANVTSPSHTGGGSRRSSVSGAGKRRASPFSTRRWRSTARNTAWGSGCLSAEVYQT